LDDYHFFIILSVEVNVIVKKLYIKDIFPIEVSKRVSVNIDNINATNAYKKNNNFLEGVKLDFLFFIV